MKVLSLNNKLILRRNWTLLRDNIGARDKPLLGRLFTEGAISQDERADIETRAERSTLEQNEELLNVLIRSDDQRFETFRSVLAESYPWLTSSLQADQISEEDRRTYLRELRQKSCLPDIPEYFVGRETEVNQIVSSFTGDGRILYVVQGAGGFGKTTIALAAGHRFMENYGALVIMLNLDNIASAEDVVLSLGSILKLQLISSGRTLRLLLCDLVQRLNSTHDPVCVIFDACESALCDKTIEEGFLKILETLHQRCPNTAILCTTREALTPRNATLHTQQLVELSEDASVSLLNTYCTEMNSTDAVTLANKCGHMPLMLHVVGGLLSHGMKPSVLIDRLGTTIEKYLKVRSSTYSSVQACIDMSYDRLDNPEKQGFRFLSLFPGSFTLEDAQLLFQSDDLEVLDLLQNLCKRSLLNFDSSEKCYSLHAIIRAYGLQMLVSEGDHDEARCQFILSLESTVKKLLAMCDENNIQDARLFYNNHAVNLTEGARLFKSLTDSSKATARHVLYLLSRPLFVMGYFPSLGYCEDLFSAYQDDPRPLADLHFRLAYVKAYEVDIEAAHLHNTKALALYENIPGCEADAVSCCFELDSTHYLRKDLAAACGAVEKAIRICDTQGDTRRRRQFEVLLHARQLELTRSNEDLQQIQDAIRKLPQIFPETASEASVILNNIAFSVEKCKHPQEALAFYKMSLSMGETLYGSTHSEMAITLYNTARVLRQLERDEEALALYEKSFKIREAVLGDHTTTAKTLTEMASILAHRGDLDRSLDMYFEALAIWERVEKANGDGKLDGDMGTTLFGLADTLKHKGDLSTALKMHQRALKIRQRGAGESLDSVKSLHEISSIQQSLGCLEDAEEVLQKALGICENIYQKKPDATLADTLFLLGDVHQKQDNLQLALNVHQRALDIRRQVFEVGDSSILESQQIIKNIQSQISESTPVKKIRLT
ncbi:uncharacterized protein LOC106162306 [Lingula anatina]|uniref:Uncharacterized protein LOC106162306 n=1 Tax=Lingula anatina TaxID=7574 RepID=A0A2R2MP29_LINAN|nr:uncharacterized protein LOC106162306 [Lingula anatina]|eukprot:XP_023931953.1 uncharacterized protein LOC106162306 [Lingula anatina]